MTFSRKSPGEVRLLGMPIQPRHSVTADGAQPQSFSAGMLRHRLHQASGRAGATQGRRRFHMWQYQDVALPNVISESRMASLGPFETLKGCIIPEHGQKPTFFGIG